MRQIQVRYAVNEVSAEGSEVSEVMLTFMKTKNESENWEECKIKMWKMHHCEDLEVYQGKLSYCKMNGNQTAANIFFYDK